MKNYIVRAKTAPDRKVVNRKYPYGEDKEKALRHLGLLKKQGWKADILLVESLASDIKRKEK